MTELMQIRQDADALCAYTVQAYRVLHRMPERSGHETRTNAFLRGELDAMRVPYLAPAPNITIALLQGAQPGATVGLRCDTDALPVRETTGLAYASETDGCMHACGHDAHMAAGLAAARILKGREDQMHGCVKLIFQPSEEGDHGADNVIRTGLVNDVDVFFALHVWSPYPTGELYASPVTVSAAVDMFTVHITGRGGHGATPERCRDALLAGAALTVSLQAAVSRLIAPTRPAVLTLGGFHAGSVGNIIAGEADLTGTIRAVDEETRTTLENALRGMAAHTAANYGCDARVEIDRVSGAVVNDPRATLLAAECAEVLYGKGVVRPQTTFMLGDDFASYASIAPCCYAQVGIADAVLGSDAPHHSGLFRVDELVLPKCAAWLAAFALQGGQSWASGTKS